MSINSYRIFAAVVEHRSFVEAANRLFLTPSAISHAIGKLEEALGLTLFHRTRLGVVLTGDGEMLLPSVMEVLNAEERLAQSVADIKGIECGNVCVAMFDSVCVNYFPQIARSFRADHANIEIGVYQGGYDDIIGWLRTGYADMGFISRTVLKDDLDATPLFDEPMLCLTSRDFVPVNKKDSTAEDVRGQIPHTASVYPIVPAFKRSVVLAKVKNRPLSSAHQAMHDTIVSFFKTLSRTKTPAR